MTTPDRRTVADEDVVTLYRSGLSSRQVGECTGMHERRVLRILARHGIPRRGKPSVPLTQAQRERIVALRSEGVLVGWVAEDVGCNRKTVGNIYPNPSEEEAWSRVWNQIRTTPALLALHREFTPNEKAST